MQSMGLKKAGKVIGEGYNKICYLLGETEVALIPHPDADPEAGDVSLELKKYKKLARAGLSVPPARIETVLLGRKRRRALVMPRYKYHSRNAHSELDMVVDKRMLKSLERIFFQLKKTNLYVSDLQFVWDTADDLKVCDPGFIEKLTGELHDNESLVGIAAFIETHRGQCQFKTKISEDFLRIAVESDWLDSIG